MKSYSNIFSFLSSLSEKSDDEFIQTIADSLNSSDRPSELIMACFEFLGHTDERKFVSKEDYLKFQDYEKTITEDEAKKTARLLFDLGLKNVVDVELPDYFLGVQVGLETNRRKNTGGDAFGMFVQSELKGIQIDLLRKGLQVELKEEYKILYKDKKTSKKVDFCLLHKGKPVIGIEVNFYTVSGSKPTEIKRSYGQVNQELAKVGCELVWITDGVGYEDMKKSLKEAFDIHKNTYNFKMMERDLEGDIIDFLTKRKG